MGALREGKGLLALAAGVLVAGTLAACSAGGSAELEPASDDRVARVERGDLNIQVEASGLVEPILVVEVKSKASGEVTRLYVDTGDEVERGDLLAEVDPRDVRNALAQAEADLEVARARRTVAESQAERAGELREASVVTQQELETSLLDLANARAQLVKAETNLELAREKMGDVTIRAPIRGTIIEKTVEAGQIIASASGNVSGGTTLMQMADLTAMQVRTLVDETDIGKVQPGQAARVQVEAYPNRAFVGTVLKVEPRAVVEQNVTMFPVLVRLENRDGLLRPNMNAEVQIAVAQRSDVLLVPNASVVSPPDALAAAQVLGVGEEALRGAMGGRGTGRAAGPANDQDGGGTALAARSQSAPAARRGDGPGRASGPAPSADTRPALVFVEASGRLEPRRVLLGVNDWDRSEVVQGLEEGEAVVLVSVARLRQQQEDMMNRIRERSSPIPGGGGGRR